MVKTPLLRCWTLVVLLSCFSLALASTRASVNATHVLKDLLDPNFYDKRLRPNFEGDPVEVSLSLFISSIGGLDEQEMQFDSTFFLRQTWKDPRLAYGNDYKTRNLTLGGDIMDQIWKSDTYINNEKSSTAPPNQFLLKIYPDGTVIYSQRMTVLASCMMYLHNYPMDKQRCSIVFESYGMNTDDLILSWASKPYKNSIAIADGVTLSQFALEEYTAEKTVANYSSTGSFTILKLSFLIRRKKFYYVVQTYIPTILITILSWVSFWIPRSSPPARVALGITTVLALTTLIFGIQSSMPKVSYVKAIDWFLMISFLFVFTALIEYPSSTFIKFQAKKISKTGTTILRRVKGENAVNGTDYAMKNSNYGSTNHSKELEEDFAEDDAGEMHDFRKTARFNGGTENNLVANPKTYEQGDDGLRHRKQKERDMENFKENFTDSEVTNVVDKYARILFPLTYFLYNVGYWTVYLLEIDLLT